MNPITRFLTGLFILLFFICISLLAPAQTSSLHNFRVKNIQGDSISLSQFAGKRLMIVNTASFCGYTPQFTQLQQLYQSYHMYNFEILGFPCNDFGNQDPYSDSTINSFCTGNYNVTFPMMSRIYIVTGDTSPVYRWLQRADLNGVANAQVAWNFNKFLVDENGHWVQHLLSNVNPMDPSITSWILQNPSSATEVKEKHYEIISDATSFRVATAGESLLVEVFSTSGLPVLRQWVQGNKPIGTELTDGLYLVNIYGKKGVTKKKIVLTH